jgi:hypothetical protein
MRALANRGMVPDLASSGAKLGLSPQILDFIRKNVDLGQTKGLAEQANKSGVSQEAQLEQAHNLQVGSIRDQLAARGLYNSGALGSLLGQEEQQYTQGRYAADQQLADYIAGVYAAFANAEAQRQAQLRGALESAAERARAQQGSTPPPAGSTPPPQAPVPEGYFNPRTGKTTSYRPVFRTGPMVAY